MRVIIVAYVFSLVILSIVDFTNALRGSNVCTQVQSVMHVDRIPTGGIMTQTIRYTTRCGLIGQCSKYRVVYVPGYREKTKLQYRVVQVCCQGFVKQGRVCVVAPPPTQPPKGPKTDVNTKSKGTVVSGNAPGTGGGILPGTGIPGSSIPGSGVPGKGKPGFGVPGNGKPGNGLPSNGIPGQGTGHNQPGINAGVGGNPVYDGNTGSRGTGGSGTGRTTGTGNVGRNGGPRGGSGPWVGLGPGPGVGGTGIQRNNGESPQHPRYNGQIPPVNRDKDGGTNVNVNGMHPDVYNNGPEADPGYQPRNYDPVMAFVSSATAAIGVLTLASTILGIFLLHRRQQFQTGGGMVKPFTSFKLRSMGSGKTVETKVEMQTLTSEKNPSSGKDKGKEKNKSGRFRADCPYVDIEQMRNAGTGGTMDNNIPMINTSGNNSTVTTSHKSRRHEDKRSLPPQPPTYAVVRKLKNEGKDHRMSISSICGGSSSFSASLDGPLTQRESLSAHIYAQIKRKSKGISSAWSRSSSLPSRPTTVVSNPDLQSGSSFRALESFTSSLGRATNKLNNRVSMSGSESSGYSSLQESKETLLYDTCDRRADRTGTGGVAPAALYRTLKEKGLFVERTQYDKLSRGVKSTPDNDAESLTRGYATLSIDTL